MKTLLIVASAALALAGCSDSCCKGTCKAKAAFAMEPPAYGGGDVKLDGGAKLALTGFDVAGENWGAGSCELWNLMLCRTNDYMKSRSVWPAQGKDFRREKLADGERFVWRKFQGAGSEEAVEEVWVTVRKDGGKTRWRLGCTAKPGWSLYYTDFPRLSLKGDVGGEADRLMWGGGESGVIRNPSDAKKHPNGVLVNGRQPAHLAAQFFCRYTDDRLFYFAAEDGEGWDKGLVVVRQKDGTMMPTWRRRGWDEGKSQMPYDIVTAALKPKAGEPCDWYDAADLYREWALRQRWCAKTLLERDDLSDFWRQAPVCIYINRNWMDKPDFLKACLDKRASDGLDGAPAIATVVGWEKWWEWVGFDYFPMYPSDEKTTAMLKDLRARGIRPFLWPSTYNYATKFRMPDYVSRKQTKATDPWDFDHTEQAIREGVDKIASTDEKGEWQHHAVWMGTGGQMASLCFGAPETQGWFERTSIKPLMERGAALLQMDQFNMACFRSCWSRSHGHCPHTGVWKTECARKNMKASNELIRKYDKDGVIAFEGPNEQFIDLIALQDTRDCRFFSGSWANAYTYLYHGYVIPFQAGIHENRYWFAKVAAEGQMPRMLSSTGAYKPDGDFVDPMWRKFCVGWARLWRGEGKPYLAYGRQVRPPKMECKEINYKDNWRGIKVDMTVPAVFHAAFLAADGSKAVSLVNATDEEQKGTLVFRGGKRVAFTVGPRELKLLKY